MSSFLPGAGGCSRLSSSRPHVQDGGDLQSPSFPALWDVQPGPDQGFAPPASSTIPAPHWGFLPDLPKRTPQAPTRSGGP